MADKIFATVGMALFVAFVGVLLYKVHEPDLWIVVIGVTIMGIVDFWSDARKGPAELEPGDRF